eukprot:Hpha_TRINITY_DN9851_c0_g1::TRINITY_DN9851_c0_g1_i2::g.81335::m.81335
MHRWRGGAFLADGAEIAHGEVIMVCVAGKPGSFKSSPAPERVRALSKARGARPRGAFGLARVPRQPDPGAFVHTIAVRYSDEDVNRHANHSATARYVYDARMTLAQTNHPLSELARLPTAGIELEYLREQRAGDELKVLLGACPGGGISVHVLRGSELTGRGLVHVAGQSVGKL